MRTVTDLRTWRNRHRPQNPDFVCHYCGEPFTIPIDLFTDGPLTADTKLLIMRLSLEHGFLPCPACGQIERGA